MALIFNIPSNTYGAGTHLESRQNIPQSAKRIKMTITREGWPPGVPYEVPNSSPPRTIQNTAGSISIIYPDGSPGPGQTFSGGDLYRDARSRKFSPIVVPVGFRLDHALYEATGEASLIADPNSLVPIDILVTEEYFEFSWFNQETGILDLPKGFYTFQGECFVQLTTAIKGERF